MTNMPPVLAILVYRTRSSCRTMYSVQQLRDLRVLKPFITPSISKTIFQPVQPFSSSGKPKKSGIYTKTGDTGFTSLYNGERRTKADESFNVLGHQDELNAAVGVAAEYCLSSNNGLEEKLRDIQSRLFDLGAAVATPRLESSESKIEYTKFESIHTQKLEHWIDNLDATLPPLKNFVLPSGGLAATHLHIARTICRRAERAVVPLVYQGAVDSEVGRYLNRLSDFFFVAARFAAKHENRAEIIWRKSA